MEAGMDPSLMLALSMSLQAEGSDGAMDFAAMQREIEAARQAEERFMQAKIDRDLATVKAAQHAAIVAERAAHAGERAEVWLARLAKTSVMMPAADSDLPWQVGCWRLALEG
jgi:hypothetical protein